jgi:hypothetical protein
MAKYLREIAKKSAGDVNVTFSDKKLPKGDMNVSRTEIGGDNKSTEGTLNIDDFNAAPGNRDFAKKHKVQKWEDRNGNKDQPFTGNPEHYVLNSKKEKRHGNMLGAAEKVYEGKGMKCESCNSMYEGESCGCGKSVPEAKPGKKGMLVDKKKLTEVLKISEGAKVDRMVKHIKASEKAAGKSDEKAEDIAWATANKRGMLNNKNKKVQEQAPADTPMKLTYPSDEVGQVGRV